LEKNKYVLAEEGILEFWQKNKIFEKSVAKEAPKGDYIFYEGPPTANGKPGIHHVIARIFKDLFPRYKTMQGYRVPRKAGWDTHGLPVELEVEKELGLKNKKEVEEYGVAEFNKKCQESVWRYKEDWEKLTRRMAFWLDLANPYITYENYYIESVWHILKQIWDKGLLYLGHKVVPYCPRCGTPLSSHEVAQGYKNIQEDSVYLKFKVTKGNDKIKVGDFILSWTTTPWTLPGNVALAVGEKVEYVRVPLKNGDVLILAEPLYKKVLGAEEYNDQSVERFVGQEMVGIEYEPLFLSSIDPGDRKAWYVATADFVTVEDGTGVVHTAVMYGEEDYELGEQINLPKVHTVDEAGRFNAHVQKWQGRFVKDVEQEIVADLKARGLLFAVLPYQHDYPFCWRCDTPLLYYAKESWFIKMSAVRDDLIKNNQAINWVPDYIKEGRFGEWLAGVKDWALSRERYWGTPLPIWVCKNGHKLLISGKKELLNKGI
jgi:isoleucyl-tRNA synthetase